MTSFSSCCVSCPDCGLRFSRPGEAASGSYVSDCFTCRGRRPPALSSPSCDCFECRPGANTENLNPSNSSKPPVFKKPLLKTLLSSIWNPFKGSDVNVGGNLQKQYKQMNPHRQLVKRPTQQQPQHQGLKLGSDDGSMVSRTSSWVTGLFNWNWNNSPGDLSNRLWRKRKIPTTQRNDYDDSDDDDSQMVPDYSKKKWERSAGQFGQTQAAQLEKRIARTREKQEQYETSYYSSESDNDRLNLQQFLLLPPLSKHERIQNWLDKLHINMQNMSTCRGFCVSACECKRKKIQQKTELIMSYMIKSGEETKKLQKTLAEHEDNRVKEFQLLKSLTKASEDVKAEISDCVKTQRNIIDKFLLESSNLDSAFNAEEIIYANQNEANLQALQDKLCADIHKKESHSMVCLLST